MQLFQLQQVFLNRLISTVVTGSNNKIYRATLHKIFLTFWALSIFKNPTKESPRLSWKREQHKIHPAKEESIPIEVFNTEKSYITIHKTWGIKVTIYNFFMIMLGAKWFVCIFWSCKDSFHWHNYYFIGIHHTNTVVKWIINIVLF